MNFLSLSTTHTSSLSQNVPTKITLCITALLVTQILQGCGSGDNKRLENPGIGIGDFVGGFARFGNSICRQNPDGSLHFHDSTGTGRDKVAAKREALSNWYDGALGVNTEYPGWGFRWEEALNRTEKVVQNDDGSITIKISGAPCRPIKSTS